MTDKKAEIPFTQNAVEFNGNKAINEAIRKNNYRKGTFKT
jgi:hypothetical protein